MSQDLKVIDSRIKMALKGSEVRRAIVDSVHGQDATVRLSGALVTALVPDLPSALSAGDIVEVQRPRGLGGSMQVLRSFSHHGSIAAQSLEGVTIRPSGGDDGLLINAALLDATAGTVFHFLPGTYVINTEVVVSKDNIYFVGAGGASNPASSTDASTVFRRTSGTGRMVTWDKAPGLAAQGAPAPQYVINGGGMSRIVIDGNLLASTGLRVVTARNLTFTETTVRGATVNIDVTNHGTTGGAPDTYDSTASCEWRHLEVIGTTGTGIKLRDWAYALGFHDVAITMTSSGGVGIDLYGIDDVWFHDTRVLTQNAGGIAIRATGDDFGGKAPTGVHFIGGYCNGSGTDYVAIGNGFDIAPIVMFHGMGTVDSEMTMTLDAGSHLAYTDMEGRMNLRLHARTTSSVRDDFIGGANTTTTLGELGWAFAAGGTGTLAFIDSVANHPGIRRMDTGATINSPVAIYFQNSTTLGMMVPTETFDSEFIFRLNQADTNTICRVGFGMAPNGNPPTDGLFLEKVSADTSWFAVCRAAGTQTRSSAITAVSAGAWVRLRIRRHDSGTIGFSIGDTINLNDSARITTNIPSVTLNAFFDIQNSAAAVKNLDVDYFALHITGMAR